MLYYVLYSIYIYTYIYIILCVYIYNTIYMYLMFTWVLKDLAYDFLPEGLRYKGQPTA